VTRRLVRNARRHGIRVLGPSAYGVVNTDPAIGLRVLSRPHDILAGRIAVFADGDEQAAALLGGLAERGLGISTFVGAGEQGRHLGNDLIESGSTTRPRT